MKIMSSGTRKVALFVLLSSLVGGSLTALCLFNLASFYDLGMYDTIKVIMVTFISLGLLVGFSHKLLLAPVAYLRDANRENIAVLILLFLVFGCLYYLASDYYWVVPQSHRVDICYPSDDAAAALVVRKMYDFETGRIYSARVLEHAEYPVAIPSDGCISGTLQALVERDHSWEGLGVVIDAKGGDESVLIGINGETATLRLTATDDSAGTATMILQAGADQGVEVNDIWGNGMTTLFRWICLLLASAYSALLVFGLTELILSHGGERILAHRVLLGFVLVYFLAFGILMAHHGGQPDQTKHLYYSSRYAEGWGFPKEDLQSAFYVQDNVYFYYWLNGAVMKMSHWFRSDSDPVQFNRIANAPSVTGRDVYMLRLLSVFMSMTALIYLYRLASSVTGNKYAGVLVSFFAANTLMFVFVSGGVSSDNFLVLSSVAAIFHIVCILKREDFVRNTGAAGTWLCLGALSKNEGALLAFIVFLVWLTFTILNRQTIAPRFASANAGVVAVFALAAILFLEFYGGNLIRYHRPIPVCEQIKPMQACTRFAHRRSQIQELDLSRLWSDRDNIVGPFEYAVNFWFFNMVNGIWGIVSHNTYVPKFWTSLHGCLLIWGSLCMARYWERKDEICAALLVILVSYAGYVFWMNYVSELRYDFRHYAVQGRYLFPVLGVLLVLVTAYFLKIQSLFMKRMTLSLALIIYFAGGAGVFIFMYSEVFSRWRIYF